MKSHRSIGRVIFTRIVTLSAVVLSVAAGAATLDLATVPLTTATNTAVKPNLMFVLDNSGSMNWDYMPDWVVDARYCKDHNGYVYSGSSRGNYCCRNSSGSYITSSTKSSTCLPTGSNLRGMPPFYSADFNKAYYDPAIKYDPPKGYDGTALTSYNGTSSAVPLDGYGVQTNDTIRLTQIGSDEANYPDVEWCNGSSTTDCLRNDNYLLPGTINGDNYTTMRTAAAKGTATFATSSTTTETRSVGPFYYVMVPAEYCSDEKLTTCAAHDAPTGAYTKPAKLRWCSNTALTTCQAIQTSTYKYPRYPTVKAYSGGATVPGSFKRFDIVSGQTYANYVHPSSGAIIVNRNNRTDCTKVTPTALNGYSEYECSYAQELKNFANWFAWYRTRMQMMKSSVSLAFQSIDDQYRVGFYTINDESANYLKINTFKETAGEQKDLWYQKLKAADPDGGTPLRSSLANVGRIYAGKNPLSLGTSDDPVQYSCQQNFAILTTDGYWNSDSSTDIKTVTGGSVGNMDRTADRPMYEGGTASSGSLADVAKYYYDTDLRTSAFGNCTGSEGADVCVNDVFTSTTDNNAQQHMTTFTLGLGIDGTLQYQKDYKTATSGDFYNIKTGTGTPSNWSVPAQDTATAIDDLWHAAVNGKGTYFSVKNAGDLSDGLNEALSTISIRRGAGAAAATSSLNPVAGDNFAYVASYTTVKWIGNLEGRTIDLTSGVVSENASWCIEDVYASTCQSPSSVVDAGSFAYCVTPSVVSASACPSGTYDSGAQTCSVQIAKACTGKLKPMVSAATDIRTIWMGTTTANAGAPLGVNFSLQSFAYDNMTTEQQAYFAESTLGAANGLTQWSALTTTQKTAAAGANLVNYLRGHTGYEDRSVNVVDNRLYRYREAVLGDAIESQPTYVGKPQFSYADNGYATFISNQASRVPTVYIGTNDGMLHAFNADSSSSDIGKERWAFVPSMVIPNMWKLADKLYANKHTNYVNGSPIIADVYDSAAAAWKTILVSGLNGGGRGYFALDVTNPTSPTLLWEIDENVDADIGYTYGRPVVTKKEDGTWVVLLTSGYNNTNDGKGYLYVRNALTGAAIDKLSTGEGSSTTPSGLAKVSVWVHDPMKNNTASYVYGGDLLGNLWRFDINTSNASAKVKKFAVLKDGSGNTQPVTTEPEMALINGQRAIVVGTGKYLELADLTNTQRQTLYVITDDESGATLNDPRNSGLLVEQTITNTSAGNTRELTATAVDWVTKRGWFVDFPDTGERVHVNPAIDGETIFIATTVPSDTACSPGGYGWLNFFDYTMGSSGTAIVAQKFNGPIVGLNIYYTPDGQRRVSVTTSNNPTPTVANAPPSKVNKPYSARRAIWREITPP
ncbi:MAG: hypothetical protein C4516_02560 [Oxalobacter sp.]|nr:MAG: hypothetical protein C4516_02560 [Oxalobacter sp.]